MHRAQNSGIDNLGKDRDSLCNSAPRINYPERNLICVCCIHPTPLPLHLAMQSSLLYLGTTHHCSLSGRLVLKCFWKGNLLLLQYVSFFHLFISHTICPNCNFPFLHFSHPLPDSLPSPHPLLCFPLEESRPSRDSIQTQRSLTHYSKDLAQSLKPRLDEATHQEKKDSQNRQKSQRQPLLPLSSTRTPSYTTITYMQRKRCRPMQAPANRSV